MSALFVPMLSALALFPLAAAAAGNGPPGVGDGGERAVRVGEPFPDLRLPTVDGARTLSLSSLRGRKLLILEFASW